MLWAAVGCDGGAPIAEAAALPPSPTAAPPTPVDIQPALREALPTAWAPLPTIARAAAEAATAVDGVNVAAAAWGDPAAGCYLAVIDLRGTRRDVVRLVIEKLGWHLDAVAAMHAWRPPTAPVDPAVVTGELTVGSSTGSVRAVISSDARSLPRAGLAACFHNEREPAACQAVCARLLPQLQAPPVTP